MVKSKRSNRTDRQRWHYERNYFNYGRLKAMVETLDQITSASSTLALEKVALNKISNELSTIVLDWNIKPSRDISWEKFKGGSK